MKNRKYVLNDLTSDLSFLRWATGEANPEEAKEWNDWVASSEKNRKLAIQAQNLLTGIAFQVPEADYRTEDWNRIEKLILDSRKSKKRHFHNKRERNSSSYFLKVAAAFFVLAVAGLAAFYTMNETNTNDSNSVVESLRIVETNFSEKKKISLSDGSEITLAAGSRLSYHEKWLQEPTLRMVLENGEAFFSIEPDADKNRTVPRFEVETEDGVTAVMGTKFSVTTYGEGTRVVLEEGEVKVIPTLTDHKNNPEMTLVPGEMAQWSKLDPSVVRTAVNPRVYTSWVSDHLFFDDTPLSYLVDRIEKTYGVDVEVDNPELLNLQLSGAVDFYGLDELSGAVSDVLDIEIRHENGKVILTRK